MLKLFFEILICPNGHTMNGESDAIVKLIFFVFQTLLSIFLGIIDLGRFRDNFRGVFLGFLSGMKGFKKISRNA